MLLQKDKKIIGEIIKRERKTKKLTQANLAELVGLNEKQISRIEAGQNFPTYLTFVKLVEVLDLDLKEFESAGTKLNLIQQELISIIKSSSEYELRLFLEIIKPLRKCLKQ